MNEPLFASLLATIISPHVSEDDRAGSLEVLWEHMGGVRRIQHFAAAGILTDDAGLVIDGSAGEIQITIVRSR